MAVVKCHVGSPNRRITAQNDRTILVLKLMESSFSGGGSAIVASVR